MKKALMAVALCALLCACAAKPVAPDDYIAPKSLTKDQKDVLEMIQYSNIYTPIFDYSTKSEYKQMELYVETYIYGELYETLKAGAMFTDDPEVKNGSVSVLINENEAIELRFICSGGGTKMTTSCVSEYKPDWMGRAHGILSEAEEISDGKPIVLYGAFFTSDGVLRSPGDLQDYGNNPKELAEYSFVYLVKCRFTK